MMHDGVPEGLLKALESGGTAISYALINWDVITRFKVSPADVQSRVCQRAQSLIRSLFVLTVGTTNLRHRGGP